MNAVDESLDATSAKANLHAMRALNVIHIIYGKI